MNSVENIKPIYPYRFNIIQSLSKNFDIVNYGSPSRSPIRDLLKYFTSTKIFYFSWIEQISWRQAILFLIFLIVSKLVGKKISWTHHNVHPHKGSTNSSRFMIWMLKTWSNFIIIHTTESYSILNLKKSDKRCLYYFHPFFKTTIKEMDRGNSTYDILIWGNVRKSKGVPEFLAYLKENDLLNQFRIMIVGKFESNQLYADMISKFSTETITFKNAFIEEKDLDLLHSQTNFVFFPYTGTSVLNSGALITSLPKGAPIIGPNTGAFKELGDMNLISTYNTFSDVVNIVKANSKIYPTEKILKFINFYTWESFAKFLSSKLTKKI